MDVQNCLVVSDFTDIVLAPVAQTSYGENYLALHIKEIDKTVIIPSDNFNQVQKILNHDYCLSDSLKHVYDFSTYTAMSLLAMKTLKTATNGYLKTYIQLSNQNMSANVIVSADTIYTYFTVQVDNKTFLLLDNFDQFFQLRSYVESSNSSKEFKNLKRVISSWNTESLAFFESCTRRTYNSFIINTFIKSFSYVPPITSIFVPRQNRIAQVAKVPSELGFMESASKLPFIIFANLDNAILFFPATICTSQDIYFDNNFVFSTTHAPTSKTDYTIFFEDFKIVFQKTKFGICPLSNRKASSINFPADTKISLPFRSVLTYGTIFSCDECKNFYSHETRCQDDSIRCTPLINGSISFCSINVLGFKDSPNLVRTASILKLESIADLCNVTSCKYSNSLSKIDPKIFIDCYREYLRATNTFSNYSSLNFFDYIELYKTSSSYFIDADEGKQIDIFGNLTIKIGRHNSTMHESDRCFVYIGLKHNIHRFVEFVNKLSNIFSLPDNCRIKLNYKFDGYYFENVKLPVPHVFDASFHKSMCVEISRFKAVAHESNLQVDFPFKTCSCFTISKTPFCTHNEYIEYECFKCEEAVLKYNMLYQYLIKIYGFGYDVNHPKLIPITEEASYINLILLKPNALKGKNLRIIVDCLKKHDNSITLDSCSEAMRIPERLFEGLYPSAANGKRRFSKHWFEYMTSDNVVLFVLRGNLSYHSIRNACLEARKISNIEWTKNIVHSAESDEEYDLFFELVIESCRTHPRLQPYSPISYNDTYANFIADYFEAITPNKKQKC